MELVHYQAKHDVLLEEHLKTARGNCTYLSPDIQNELITCLANSIVKKICQEVKEAFKYFTILLDETSDMSRQEQVSFILRYVNTVGKIEERFIGVVTVSETDGSTLVKAVEDMFDKHGLALENLRGQGYDGAANMSGQYSGVQSRLAATNPKALYVHCHAHVLNLVIVEACTRNHIARDFLALWSPFMLLLEPAQSVMLFSRQCSQKRCQHDLSR